MSDRATSCSAPSETMVPDIDYAIPDSSDNRRSSGAYVAGSGYQYSNHSTNNDADGSDSQGSDN
ncbi:hypothetical protein THASP1DRAFT_29494 [Thamnocephalis sphaerospora]|uniref:Uncharacterized protein n=1 Tax=Thamnocephalis sphaerospora TaxID=78915 RepID=A0A4P9XRI4_9FUNG|nr:hypothetical protein THASP1DRAFT_29494 [Thamnocephalis sphaerospora]|eukprot:RKP08707.1 hypothetical protein THASP1DRAFT_29494 [Thamnocephalis sphaerospora]